MDLVGGVLLGALGPVCCLEQRFVLYSVLLGNVLRIIF